MMQRAPQTQPLFKKIDNYVFRFDDLLGTRQLFESVQRHQLDHKYLNHHVDESVAIKVIELNSLKSKSWSSSCSQKSTC